MTGIELCRRFYETYGKEMLERQFPEWVDKIAVGLAGSGSECFGFDDAYSRDHDFSADFCIFLPEESVLPRRVAFLMERAYAELPKEFSGVHRQTLSPVGGNRRGVLRMGDFFAEKTGSRTGELSLRQWLALPDYLPAEAVNGAIFRDDSGTFTAIRQRLAYYPEDVRCKKLAGYLLSAAQSGLYNYGRCLQHGEPGAAQLALGEFATSVSQSVFLLNRRYMPYYKWRFRALRGLPILPQLADALEYLLQSENDSETAKTKSAVIADICNLLIAELCRQQLSDAVGDLGRHAYAVNDRVRDNDLRSLHILAAV